MSYTLPVLDRPSQGDGKSKYNITGVPFVNNEPGIRRNILELSDPSPELEDHESIKRQWNLYLKALQNFQNSSTEEHDLSYYQVAGIHGAPFTHWMEEPLKDDRPGNYCTHGSSLFLTWHRPYLLLFEQRIVEEALKYAGQIEDEETKSKYVEDAKRLRIPYWDWASDHTLPKPVRHPEIKITLPDPSNPGSLREETIKNPLYAYQFKSELRITRDFSLVDGYWWSQFLETKRCPKWEAELCYPSHPETADEQIVRPKDPNPRLPTDYRDGILHLLTQVKEYGPFSNNGYYHGKSDAPKNHFTLESYHNSVHNYTGTDYSLKKIGNTPPPTGHMSEVPVSAFDPIFWLHHANIDRIYAMWQAINYEAEFQGQVVEATRLPPIPDLKALDSPSTGLRPFYQLDQTTGGYKTWDSSMIQLNSDTKPRIFDHGYTYPEIPYSYRDHEYTLMLHVRARTYALYGIPKSVGYTFHKLGHLPDGVTYEDIPVDILSHIEKEGKPLPAKISAQTIAEYLVNNSESQMYREDTDIALYRRAWVITLKVKRYLVKGNFTIFFFLGEPDSEPNTWATSPKQAGSFSTFKSQSEKCVNCSRQEKEGAILHSGIDITEALYKALPKELQDQPDTLARTKEITAWLTEHLQWGVLVHDTRESLNLESLVEREPDGLVVKVSSHMVPFPVAPFKNAIKEAPGSGRDGVIKFNYQKYDLFDEQVHEEVTRRRQKYGGYSS